MFDILTIGEMLIDLTQTGVSDAGIPVMPTLDEVM